MKYSIPTIAMCLALFGASYGCHGWLASLDDYDDDDKANSCRRGVCPQPPADNVYPDDVYGNLDPARMLDTVLRDRPPGYRCAYHTYVVSLAAVDGHPGLLATPIALDYPGEDSCPSLAFHAVRNDQNFLEKVVRRYGGEGEDDAGAASLPLGAFPLYGILKAHHLAPVGVYPGQHEYDLHENNCAFYLLNLVLELGIRIGPGDERVLGFVRDQLKQHDGHIRLLRALGYSRLLLHATTRKEEKDEEEDDDLYGDDDRFEYTPPSLEDVAMEFIDDILQDHYWATMGPCDHHELPLGVV